MIADNRAVRLLGVLAPVIALVCCVPGCEQKGESPTAAALESKPRIGVLPKGAPKPNIVFILVDALRADRLGVFGHRGNLTPTIDTIANEGVTFARCVAPAPWTLPSVASLFVSYYPGVHKATSYGAVESMEQGKTAYQSVLSDEFETLAEALKAHGYDTAGFCANKFIRERYGFAQGFDHFDTSFAENTVEGSNVNEAALKWLEGRGAGKPFFMYLHYMDAHGPYNSDPKFMDPLMGRVEANPDKQLLSPGEFKAINAYLKKPPTKTSDPERYERLKGYREYWEARYEAGVAEADFYLHQLVQRLTEMGVWQDAYVILLADHGEALCEHGIWDHGYSQYQTDLHVPLILRWPNVLPARQGVGRLASLIDVMPTILDQLGLRPGESLQGVSLVDHISGRLPDKPLARFAEAVKAGKAEYALFVAGTKLITTEVPTRKLPDGTTSKPGARHQLFNLATDDTEKYNLAGQKPEVLERLTMVLAGFMNANQTAKPGLAVSKRAVEQATMAHLEALGYVGGEEEEEEDEESDATSPESQPTSDAVDE